MGCPVHLISVAVAILGGESIPFQISTVYLQSSHRVEQSSSTAPINALDFVVVEQFRRTSRAAMNALDCVRCFVVQILTTVAGAILGKESIPFFV